MSLFIKRRQAAERRDRPESGDQPRSENNAALSLSAIELAVVAELNLEIARAHDEVAGDATRRVETRQAAGEVATALRERAHSLHLEARRLSAHRMYVPSMEKPASAYTGPERRRQGRRRRARRRDSVAAFGAPGACDRRAVPERRHRERRSGVLVLR
jgi:hypothetical protein